MKREHWRNSDCQLSRTAPPKSGERTYSHQDIGKPPGSSDPFSARCPASDCATIVPRKSAPKKSESSFSRAKRYVIAGLTQ